MADEIAYKIIVESDLADKSVGQLKQDFKDLTDQLNKTKIGTDEYKKTLQSLGVVKGGIQELKEQIHALNPEKTVAAFAKVGSTVASGFAAGQAAVALFGGQSEDLMKVLVKVQAATALASGIQGLTGMVRALETARLAMIAFALSNPFTAIAAGVVALGVAIYALVQAFDDTQQKADELLKSNEDLKDSFKKLGDDTDLYIRKLKATGASEQEIFEARQRQRDEEVRNQTERIKILTELFNSETGLTDAQYKELKSLEDERDATKKVKAIEALEFHKKMEDAEKSAKDKDDKDKDEKDKKRAEEKKKLKEQEWEDAQAEALRLTLIEDKRAEENKVKNDKLFEDAQAEALRLTEIEDARAVKLKAQRENEAKERIDLELKVLTAKNQLTIQSFEAIAGLITAFAGQNEKSAKRAFEINKALGIAQAVISTYQGANAIFTAAALNPATVLFPAQPFISAGIAIATGLANVAKIAKTQFNSASYSDAGSASAPSFGGGGSAEPPQFKPDNTKVNTDSDNNFKSFGDKPQVIKAYVVESEITQSQKTINKIQNNATY